MNKKTKKEPYSLPAQGELEKAWRIVDDWVLHYYQLLYFNEPRLTEPGRTGAPFYIEVDNYHRHCIKVFCCLFRQRREEFDFHIQPKDKDEDVLMKLLLIMKAIEEKKQKAHQFMCCPLAVPIGCVCAYAFRCILHGDTHIGSHD